jgi:hypothetical protein
VNGPVHPDLEALLLGDDQAKAHLRGCDQCQHRLASETDRHMRVQRWLAEQAPVSMPTEVATRVHARLEDLGNRRSDRTAPAPARPTPRHGRAQRWLLAASVAAFAVLGTSVLVPLLRNGADDPLAGADLAESSLSAEEASAGDEAADDAAALAPEPSADLPEVPAAIRSQAEPQAALPDSCGDALALQLGGRVQRASGAGDNGVLVVVEVAGQRMLWWLPSCDAAASQARGRTALE